MILYVNGDSNSAGAEATNSATMIYDDYKLKFTLNTKDPIWGEEIIYSPHPENLEVSYGKILADKLDATLHCHARSASSNDRIIRTTKEYLQKFTPSFILIGWSTWEREEWYDEEENYWVQVNGSGLDQVPEKWHKRYKTFVMNATENPQWNEKILSAHKKIWDFHNELNSKNIPHLFFNCFLTFKTLVDQNLIKKKSWGDNFLDPYSNFSYFTYLSKLGYVHTKSYHFFADGHAKWAEFLLPYLTRLL